MTKEWPNLVKQEEMDNTIKEIVKETGAAYVKLVVIENKQNFIICFKSEENMMKALGKTILKDNQNEQWKVHVQGEKYTHNSRGKKSKKPSSKKKDKECEKEKEVEKEGQETGKYKEKSVITSQSDVTNTLIVDDIIKDALRSQTEFATNLK